MTPRELIDSEPANVPRSHAEVYRWANSLGEFAQGQPSDSTTPVIGFLSRNRLIGFLASHGRLAQWESLATAGTPVQKELALGGLYVVKHGEGEEGRPGMDVGDPEAQTLLGQMVTEGLLSPTDRTDLEAAATTYQSPAQYNSVSLPHEAAVADARAV